MAIVAAILAGGKGARMGGRKPERELRGRSLLKWVAACARAQTSLIAVVVRGKNPTAVAGVRVLRDDPHLLGPIAGLKTALVWARREGATWLLTLPCDTPFAPSDLAARLRCAADGARAPASLASSGDLLHPACALWRTDLGESLDAYAESGRSSLTGLAEAVGYVAVDWPTLPLDPFFNINTLADLAESERIAAHAHLE